MPGKHATDQQVRRYMDSRRDGYSQAAAAARAGLSERTGRRIEADPVLPSQQDRTRRYRTRQDPFVEVWREELVPMLQTIPHLRATTILGELQHRHPGRYPDRLLRSLQRRVAYWRATEGPERELIFRQEHPPGRQALSDFTNGGGLAVTIAGAPFPHLLYHFWLAFSGWQYVKAICGGESFTALTESLQEALWQLGGVPREHRTDRLSAAYRNLSSQEDEATRYAEFCRYYGMEPTRNNAGVSHENGSVEAAHGISRPASAKRSNCAVRATSPILPPTRPSSRSSSRARMHRGAPCSRSSSPPSCRYPGTGPRTSRPPPSR